MEQGMGRRGSGGGLVREMNGSRRSYKKDVEIPKDRLLNDIALFYNRVLSVLHYLDVLWYRHYFFHIALLTPGRLHQQL